MFVVRGMYLSDGRHTTVTQLHGVSVYYLSNLIIRWETIVEKIEFPIFVDTFSLKEG